MADPVVHITNGIPDSGTGNITTLGQTLTDGANATLGANADAASATGSISAKLRALVTAIGTTAWDLGSGTSGSRTQRVIIDSGQLASVQTTAQAMSAGFQLVSLPTDSTLPGGPVAHDAVDSGNGHKQAAKATTALSGLTLVSSGDRTDLFAGVDGVQIVRPHANLEDLVSGLLANTDGASTSVIAAQGAGVKTYITSVIIANSSATAVTVDLRDGAAGSVKATFPVPANTSGVVCNLPVPLGFSANTAVCMDGSAAASTVTCTLIGFKSKV